MKTRKNLFSIIFILVCIGVAVPTHTAVDRDTIVGIWLFDEGISDGVKDASGNGHDGIVVGTPEVVDGKFGKALSFDGKGKVEIPHHDRFSLSTFTLMAWINIEDILSGWQMIVGKDDWPDRNYAMFVHKDGERLHCAFNTRRVDSGNFNSNATITDGSWHHVAFTYNGEVERIYIDGDLDNDKRLEGDPRTTTVPVIIGEPPFRGIIDEVFIGNAAISEDDVRRTVEDGITKFILTPVEPAAKLATTWAAVKRCCD